MVTSSAPSSALGSALRRKFRTPREAMRALRLDARLLGKDNTEAENERQRRSLTVEQCMELSEFLKSVVDDETFEKIDRFLKKAMDDASIEEQTGEPQDNVRGFLKERGMADDDIQAVLDMVPGSGENGTGKNGDFRRPRRTVLRSAAGDGRQAAGARHGRGGDEEASRGFPDARASSAKRGTATSIAETTIKPGAAGAVPAAFVLK